MAGRRARLTTSAVQDRKESAYAQIKEVMDELIQCRRQILSGTLPLDQLVEVKVHASGRPAPRPARTNVAR